MEPVSVTLDAPSEASEHRTMARRVRAGAVLVALGCVAGTVGGALVRDLALSEVAPVMAAGLLFVGAGAVASARRPRNLSGALLTLTGLAWLLSTALSTVDNAVAFTAALALLSMGLAPLGHLALVFPNGRASSRQERLLVAAPYVLALASVPVVGGQPCAECPADPIGLDITQGIGRLWYSSLLVAVLVTSLGVLAVLVRRWHRASPVARRVLLPVLPGACIFVVIYAAALLAELGLPTGLGERWALVGILLLGFAPVIYLGGLLRSRLARAAVSALVVELGGSSSRQGLRDSLALALGDPGIEVAFWIPDRSSYVGPDGSPFELPTGDPGRAVTTIEREGRHVGALVYDPAVRDDPALVDAVSAAAGLAMENERLHAEALARLEDVRASRARIVQAADAARRRVERDLHDGAQQRLVSLALSVGMARARLGPEPDPALDDLLGQATEQAGLALAELRDLGQGLHPAVLAEAGLAAALESLAERSTIPVELVVSAGGDLPAAIQAAAYFVVSESLANVSKHAQASAVSVLVGRERDRLLVDVRDDGVGGAQVRSGSGLEGLADRVAALDGRLAVESPLRGGTRVSVDLPCG